MGIQQLGHSCGPSACGEAPPFGVWRDDRVIGMAENIVRPFSQFISWQSAHRFRRKLMGRRGPDPLRQARSHSTRFSGMSTMRRSPALVISAGRSICFRLKSTMSHVMRENSSGRTPAKQPTAMIGARCIGETEIEIAKNYKNCVMRASDVSCRPAY